LSLYEPFEESKSSRFDAQWDDIQSGRAAEFVWEEIKSERLHVARDALTTLSRALRDDFVKEDLEDIYESELPLREVPSSLWSMGQAAY
jgi:hypothetical protein